MRLAELVASCLQGLPACEPENFKPETSFTGYLPCSGGPDHIRLGVLFYRAILCWRLWSPLFRSAFDRTLFARQRVLQHRSHLFRLGMHRKPHLIPGVFSCRKIRYLQQALTRYRNLLFTGDDPGRQLSR